MRHVLGTFSTLLGGIGFAVACLLFLSVFDEDKPKQIAPRPMFLVNLVAMVLLIGIAMRVGEWLGFQITAEEFRNIGKTSDR